MEKKFNFQASSVFVQSIFIMEITCRVKSLVPFVFSSPLLPLSFFLFLSSSFLFYSPLSFCFFLSFFLLFFSFLFSFPLSLPPSFSLSFSFCFFLSFFFVLFFLIFFFLSLSPLFFSSPLLFFPSLQAQYPV